MISNKELLNILNSFIFDEYWNWIFKKKKKKSTKFLDTKLHPVYPVSFRMTGQLVLDEAQWLHLEDYIENSSTAELYAC